MGPPDNEERFLALLKANEKLIHKVSYVYCRNVEDRKDLSQEIIVQVWKSFSKYDESFKFSTWLCRIAVNVAISYYRKNKKKYATFLSSDGIGEIPEASEPTESIEANHQMLYQFIYQLDELNKALMLLYLEETSYREIAAILGITETNVATKINRIKQKLKHSFLERQKNNHGT